jgi:hypothetical protein
VTSKQRRHAVLFTKEECGPCFKTKVHLHTLINGHPELDEVISVLAKENHPALVAAYDLNLYPTLLITDQNIKGDESNEVQRIVGGKAIRESLEEILTDIYTERRV